jgi:hypothetical protein
MESRITQMPYFVHYDKTTVSTECFVVTRVEKSRGIFVDIVDSLRAKDGLYYLVDIIVVKVGYLVSVLDTHKV